MRMNRYIANPTALRKVLVAALLALTGSIAITAAAADAPAAPAGAGNKVLSIDVQPMVGKGGQLIITTSGPAPTPLSFTIDNPARISIDLPDTSLAVAQRRIDVRTGGLDSILAAEGNGRSRIVLNLDHMVPYDTRVDGNRILVTLGEPARPAANPTGAAARAAVGHFGGGRRQPHRAISSIDFRRGNDGTGRVIVKLTDPRTPINLRQQGNEVFVDFGGATLPQHLQRRFDVSDFATPVASVDAVNAGNGTQLVITAAGEFEQLAYQADDQYVIELQPRTRGQGTA